ncbi:MAG: formyl transferase [Rhizobiaceae bacterium]
MRDAAKKIVFVTAGGPHPWIIANALIERFGPIPVVLEEGEPKSALIRRRIRRQGYVSAVGQLGTMFLIRLQKKLFARRVERVVRENALQAEPRAGQEIVRVPSANAPEFLAALDRLQPDLVFLAGCRVLSTGTLAGIRCPVLNYHAGITPQYRGMNGGYWALARRDRSNFGTTVHRVDAGIDTGEVIRQTRGQPRPGDNIALYAYRQAAFSREACVAAVDDVLAGRDGIPVAPEPSSLWYHPTLWGYFWTGLTRGVW